MDPLTSPSDSPHPPARRRARWLAAAFLALVIVALAVVPPLINLNRFEHRIAASMSASLGRQVTIDPPVRFHLLPFPTLELNSLVVSEDPAFGSEPTIRANTVEARLRLSSLWRRHVEFSRIKFVDPSLNLVRNPQGRWNLDNILVHAARIDAAPTAQRTAGASPRFPYIEATGARVNIKLGDEKMPFSLTDAEFALWLPSAQQWRVRLEGKPTRTDANVADAGTMRLEGSLERADRLEAVPVNLTASWHDAPLGEASLLLSGRDAGWRGTLHADASLSGPLGQATLISRITFNDLRRADFVPANSLDVSIACAATANTSVVQLTNGTCELRDPSGDPHRVYFPAVSLQHPEDIAFTVDYAPIPLQYVFSWLKLLSPRIPAQEAPAGSLRLGVQRDMQHTWTGTAALQLAEAEHKDPISLSWTVQPASTDNNGCRQALRLQPTPVPLPDDGPITLDASVSTCGYTVHATGSATETDLSAATKDLPQLMDGVAAALPPGHQPARFDVSCTRAWGADALCTAAHVSAPAKPARKPRRH